ncbi:hypothetical protein NEAUS03_0170 [Nematocida ausubeli]|nr:hypothetical protein NEAUS03_0170 [Nematocida ausubeli]
MEMRYSVICIKTVILISILLMSLHKAEMTLDEVDCTLKFEIASDQKSVLINPKGPLNFLRGYIYQKMSFMHNKRFFAPEINTHYAVKTNPKHPNVFDSPIHTRDEQMDRAYKEMDFYTKKYHNHMIELFPSPTGDITIETRSNQSFVQFLRAETTEEHSLQILAMLLLFSEGVNIPIKVNNTVLEVYETDERDEIYFKVPMVIPWLDITASETKRFEQKKVKQMIKFFQENANNHEVLRMMEDKCSLDEISTGKFLDSPKFLIQSYIFGFIDTAEHAIEFIQTVHTMTEKYAPKTEAPSKDDSVYDRLFKPAGTEEAMDCIALIKKTQEIMSMYKVFPFLDSTELPSYTSVPRYNREAKEFSTNRLEDYSNCVECMILSLFCCLAYDPAEGNYGTEHMGNVSEDLEEFFTPKENQPFDTTKAEFQKEWCRVVADLGDPIIAYCKGRNELDCGLINMLLVIAEIVNALEEAKEKVLGFLETLKKQNGELDDELCGEIQEYTEELLKQLSKTKDIEILFSDLKSEQYNNGRYDVSGAITINFQYSSIRNTIVLGISEEHSTIDMNPTVIGFKDARTKKMNEISNSCRNGAGFVENLFATYVASEIRKINKPEKNKEFMKAQVRKTIENNFTDINRLLLIKKISDFEYKTDLFFCSILYTMNQQLFPEHPVIRFTSNILGSTELTNWYVQVYMLCPLFIAGLHNKSNDSPYYPRIQLTKNQYKAIDSGSSYAFFIEYILDCNMDIFMIWAKYYIDTKSLLDSNVLLANSVNRRICKHIFKDGTMEYSDILDDFVIKRWAKKEDEITSYVHFVWTIYLSVSKNPNIRLIKANLDAIRNTSYISKKCNKYISSTCIYKQAYNTLMSLKDQLCKNNAEIEKFNLFINILSSFL